jgi:hypothetical protein
MSLWISIDPANLSGWAIWAESRLLASGTIAKVGNKGRWRFSHVKAAICQSELEAWTKLLAHHSACVCEVGRGSFRNADMPLGKRLGYIRAVCDMQQCAYHEIALSEWRRIVKEQTGTSWPATGDAKKALAVKLARDLFEVDAGPDQADAILIGWAWIKSGRAE